MQGTTYILENHVHILKYFIQLKYYTVNCLQHACACACVYVCVCMRLFSKFNNRHLHKFSCTDDDSIFSINGLNHRVCMEMPMIIC